MRADIAPDKKSDNAIYGGIGIFSDIPFDLHPHGYCRTFCRVAVSFLLIAVLDVRADWLLLLHTEAGSRPATNWEAKVEVETKFRDDMSEQYDFEAMPWVARRFTDHFKLGLGWRVLYSRNNTDIYEWQAEAGPEPFVYRRTAGHYWQVEQRPLMDFMFAMKPGGWTVEDRLRVEYRHIEDQDAFFRYRERLRLRPPWEWTRADIRPWVAWEGYYEDNPDLHTNDRLNRHRFFVGMGAKLTPALKTGCYYYREAVKRNGEWESNDEIGLELSLAY